MTQVSRSAWWVALLMPSLALVAAVAIAASTWERVRTTPQKRTLKVTGSATQRIVSDLIEWDATIETRNADRVAAYRQLRSHVDAALAYLKKEGVTQPDLRVQSARTRELTQREVVGIGVNRVERMVSLGWSVSQHIEVRSQDVPRIEKVSREITSLLERGVPVESARPRYHYTKLGALKIDMLAKAAADARLRAQKIVEAGGGAELGKMWGANMGVINVNPANSTDTSWQGNNDKSSLEKDIITVVHLTFELP